MEHDLRRLAEVGDEFLGPSGHIWTIAAFTRRGNRIVLTRPTAQGPAAAIVDSGALAKMVPLAAAAPRRSGGPLPSDQFAPPTARGGRRAPSTVT